jgi:hypothetical protein
MSRATSVVVEGADADRARAALAAALADDLAAGDVKDIRVQAPVTLVTVLVGPAVAQTANIVGRLFSALGGVGINVLAMAHGGITASANVVIAAAETQLAARSIHAAFNLAHTEVSVLALGKGVVGEQLLAHIASEAGALRARDGILVRVVGIVGSDRALFDERGIDLATWRARYAAEPPAPGASGAASPAAAAAGAAMGTATVEALACSLRVDRSCASAAIWPVALTMLSALLRTWPTMSRGVSVYMLISSTITPFSRSSSSSSKVEWRNMSLRTSTAVPPSAAAHFT